MFLVQGIPGDNSNTWYTGRAMTSLKTHGSLQGTWPTPGNWSMTSMPATPTNQSPGGGRPNHKDVILWGEGDVTTHAWPWPRPTRWNPQAHWLDPIHATLEGKGVGHRAQDWESGYPRVLGTSGSGGDMRGSCPWCALVFQVRVACREPCTQNSLSGYCLYLIN